MRALGRARSLTPDVLFFYTVFLFLLFISLFTSFHYFVHFSFPFTLPSSLNIGWARQCVLHVSARREGTSRGRPSMYKRDEELTTYSALGDFPLQYGNYDGLTFNMPLPSRDDRRGKS